SMSVLTYNASDELSQSTTYKGSFPVDLSAVPATAIKQSVTLFSGHEGEEKAQRTFNYNFDGSVIKSMSVLTYNASDELTKSTTYKGAFPVDLSAVPATAIKQSVTLFSG